MKQLTFETATITPSWAKKLLEEGNQGNRKLRDAYAKNLALQMMQGHWREGTGVPIILDEKGGIIDGQHRLTAIILANKPIKFTLVRNVSREAQDVIDTNLNRQASDVLSFSGIKNAKGISTVIRYFLTNGLDSGTKTTHGVMNATNRVIKEEYLKDPDFWDNIQLTSYNNYRQFRALSQSVFGGCHAIALRSSKFPQKVNSFFDELATGATTSSAILELRKKIINNQLSDKKYSGAAKRELIKSYFNGYIKNQKNPYTHPEGIWL
jgi:hypothetical protein